MDGFKRERNRFLVVDDLILLREVVASNPYEDQIRWTNVVRNVSAATKKNFSLRSVKEHTEHLVRLHLKQDVVKLYKAATEEERAEKKLLLEEVTVLMKQHRDGKSKTPTPLSSGATNGHVPNESVMVVCEGVEIKYEEPWGSPWDSSNGCSNADPPNSVTTTFEEREEQATGMSADEFASGKRRRTQLKQASLQFLERRADREMKLREREMDITKRKLILEESRLQLEKEKLELEKERLGLMKLEKEEMLQKMAAAEQEQKHRQEYEKIRIEKDEALIRAMMTTQETVLQLVKSLTQKI